jgi:hypothetical protein
VVLDTSGMMLCNSQSPAFGGILDRHCHLKHVSLKQSRFYHFQTSTAHRYRIKVDGSVVTISIKNFPIGLHVMYPYSPYTPRTFTPLIVSFLCFPWHDNVSSKFSDIRSHIYPGRIYTNIIYIHSYCSQPRTFYPY